jgi:hypothetical protein
MADALRGAGRYEEAYEHGQHAIALGGRTPPALVNLAHSAEGLGRHAEVAALMTELSELARTGYVPPGTMADMLALVGDMDSAVVWAARALEERSNWTVYQEGGSPGPLQRDPRFREKFIRAGVWR